MNVRPPALPSTHKDRTTLVVTGGVFIVLLGLLCAAFVPLILGAVFMAPPGGRSDMSMRQVLPGALIYAALAGGFFLLGIGIIRQRKWARDLLMAFSWIWLVVGVISFLVFSVLMIVMGRDLTATPGGPSLPAGVFWIVTGISAAVIFTIYVVIPSLVLAVFGNRNVTATIRAHHSDPCWTDALPTRVLVMFLLLVSGGFSMTGGFAYTPAVPLFGMFLTGWPAGILMVLLALLWLTLAWGTAGLRAWAWWGTLLGMALVWVSALVTFFTRDLMDLYRAMDFPAEQLAQFEKWGPLFDPWMPAFVLLGGMVFFGLLMAVKKDFSAARVPSED